MTGKKAASKQRGKPFKKGKSGNPGGRPKASNTMKELKKLSKNKFAEILMKFLYLTNEEIKEIVRNPKTAMLELMLGSVILKAIRTGDQQRLDFLLNRCIGRVTDSVDISIQPYIIRRKNGEEIEMGVDTGD